MKPFAAARRAHVERTRRGRPVVLVALLLALVVPGCGDDDGTTDPTPTPSLDDLVGSWTLEVWEYARDGDASDTADWVRTRGLTGSLLVAADGSFTVVPTLDGGTGSDDGTLTVRGDSIRWDGQNDEEWVTFELDGTLTLYWPETSFVDMDDDGQPEDAWLRVVFRRG